MNIPDVNVLLNAANVVSPHHHIAKQWFENAYNNNEPIGYAWVALLGFIRLSTKRGILRDPLPTEVCLAMVDKLLNHPAASIVQATERHAGIMGRLLMSAGTAGNLTTDAHLAALAIEQRATLVTFDRDFERFSGLKVKYL
jgi:uncharacterized protein